MFLRVNSLSLAGQMVSESQRELKSFLVVINLKT